MIAAAAQPTAAKIGMFLHSATVQRSRSDQTSADVFGRVEVILVSIFFYVLGTVIEAVSSNVETFAAGAVFYQVGYTVMIVLIEIVIADITSLRSRLFFSYVPAIPFLVRSGLRGPSQRLTDCRSILGSVATLAARP